ncbi:Berberine bridge enzyme-like 7 [Gracilariopsis chorda]|uniref:Berberine bridge enzyme-like 7 n=1 Tax=Gracilariopsis chorda TaxID=448386 RepID=A0A2V3ITX4_9FLOR|nr:Berberine bridge enzyme-like 7 [Gracilariopsis chorda]|eukprot:PXF45575.1 Berberine bridge enzyme-like 7 [Gracilariopsis chorda]
MNRFPTFIFLLLLTLFRKVYSLDRANNLKACAAKSGIPVHLPPSPIYSRLKSQSFRSDFATPFAIATAYSESHVSILIKCARRFNIRVCARSGGHSLIGHSLCKGLVIDLSSMNSVKMQPGGVAYIQPGATLGEVLWNVHKEKRWLAAGVCPSVGFAGYVLGGGHGPYEGRLGIACDDMLSLRMVDRKGRAFFVSKSKRPELFWALCGAGGGHFGVVTAFRWRTVSSGPFDRAVVFRFKWPTSRGGEVLEKWQHYSEWGGDVWFRIEVYLRSRDEGVFGYGACYRVRSVKECMRRLKYAPFFNTPARTTEYISYVRNALDVHAFFGPEGGWGQYRAPNLRKAMLNQRFTQGEHANGRIYQSTFLRFNATHEPSKKFWQTYVDFCQSAYGRNSIPWVVCEMNLFNNAIDLPNNNAFAFRSANLITNYIVGGGRREHKKFVYYWMRNHFEPYTVGVYINYADLLLKKYATAYWGSSLRRLRRVQKRWDPSYFFMNPQPIPQN